MFPPLTQEQIVAMVDNMIAVVELRLKDRDMSLELTQAAKDLLAERGFDPVLGARPLRRTIQREIEDVLAEKMLYGEVGPGQIVLVDVEGDGARTSPRRRSRSRARRSACCPTCRRSRPPTSRPTRCTTTRCAVRATTPLPARPTSRSRPVATSPPTIAHKAY